jgi:hypothetical protein
LAALPTPVDAQLAQVEQHAVVELALVDVGADLALVTVELLSRALRVEHEAMGDEVVRREVGLQAAASELREVGVTGEAEHDLEQIGEDRLGQQLLVLARPGAPEVVAEVAGAVELGVPAAVSRTSRNRPSDCSVFVTESAPFRASRALSRVRGGR